MARAPDALVHLISPMTQPNARAPGFAARSARQKNQLDLICVNGQSPAIASNASWPEVDCQLKGFAYEQSGASRSVGKCIAGRPAAGRVGWFTVLASAAATR